jgi:hypothetical protein
VIPTLVRHHPVVLDRLLKALQSETAALREGAAETLAVIALEGEAGRTALLPAVPLLKERVHKDDRGMFADHPDANWAASWSAVTLARLGAEYPVAIGALVVTSGALERWKEGRDNRSGGREAQGSGGETSVARLEKNLAEAVGRIEDKVLAEVLGPLDQPFKGGEEALHHRVVLLAGSGKLRALLPLLVRELADDKSPVQAAVCQELGELTLPPAEVDGVIRALLEAAARAGQQRSCCGPGGAPGFARAGHPTW